MKDKLEKKFKEEYEKIGEEIFKEPEVTNKMLIQTLIDRTNVSKLTEKPFDTNHALDIIRTKYKSLEELQRENPKIYKSKESLMKAYRKKYRAQ